MNAPLVHVLVINWNGLPHLRECLDTLLASAYDNVRFVLIDNASTDGSVQFVRENYGNDSRVELLELPRNLGWAGGNNEGMRRALDAGADYIFLLNNDTATAPDAIGLLVAAAEADPKLGAVAPKMLLYDNPALINSLGLECSQIASSWDFHIGRIDRPEYDTPRDVIGVCGGAAFYRAEALRRVGLLPDDFEIYLDDLDICLRMWDAGYEIRNCPEAVVRHKFSATMGEGRRARRKYYLNTRNRARVILRNYPLSRIIQTIPALIHGECRAIGRAMIEHEWWRVVAHLESYASALGYLPKALMHRRRSPFKIAGAFWTLIRRDIAFFPGMEYPKDGWYKARVVKGAVASPMSARATLNVDTGILQIQVLNPYPKLGDAAVEIRQEGRMLQLMESSHTGPYSVSVFSGTVDFISRRIFLAEETGEQFDIGAWLVINPPSGVPI